MSITSSKDSFADKILPIFMLLLGISLLYIGTDEYRVFEENIADYVRASPDNRTLWFLIIGIATFVGGIIGLLRDKTV